ncbi:hypothetical protein MNBD_NITROSPINAE05-685 [hydrothermal vent metagenome]|uniref:Uncharacterized protein n=1 Tax=hydrothermal vent metagenome TaxID=652676 RepID=A0A3B1CE49_9ZZZZ
MKVAFLTAKFKGVLSTLIKTGVLGFVLAQTLSCVPNRIVGTEFVHDNKGYAFTLPGGGWEVDPDAWRDERDFGYILVKSRLKSRFVRKPRNSNTQNREQLDIRFVPEKKTEKLLLHMDVGFRHKTRPGNILIGTISEGRLIKFVKGNFATTHSELPENLIRGYMERLWDFYPPEKTGRALVTVRTLARSGQVHRMEWIEGPDKFILYGFSLYKEFLFLAFKVDREAPLPAIEEGAKVLKRLVESVVVTAR